MQNDWAKWLFSAQVALNNRPNTRTGLSPFFVTHGYHLSPIEIIQTENSPNSEQKRADNYLSRLQEIQEFSQSAMAAAQQQQEFHANTKRSASELYREGDKVWLSYEHYESDRPKRKMDWLRGKYIVSKELPPITTAEREEEQYVDEILCARTVKRGRGSRRMVLVRWKGFADPVWEPLENLEETEALDKFEDKYGSVEENDGPLKDWF